MYENRDKREGETIHSECKAIATSCAGSAIELYPFSSPSAFRPPLSMLLDQEVIHQEASGAKNSVLLSAVVLA
jgi:hypothetical protein